MNAGDIVKTLFLDVKTPGGDLSREVTGCYISDLLSDVMAHAQEGEIWITLQTHPNIVAVAVLKNLAGIIITNQRMPEEDTLRKAEEEHMAIAVSRLSTFETGGRLYQMLRC